MQEHGDGRAIVLGQRIPAFETALGAVDDHVRHVAATRSGNNRASIPDKAYRSKSIDFLRADAWILDLLGRTTISLDG
jgi:hypothetical protein